LHGDAKPCAAEKKQAHVVICIFSKNAIFSNVATTFASVLLTKLRFFNHGRRKDFSRGAVGDFLKLVSRGAKSGEICFLPLEIEKTTFFAHNFKIQGAKAPPSPLPTPMSSITAQVQIVDDRCPSGKISTVLSGQ